MWQYAARRVGSHNCFQTLGRDGGQGVQAGAHYLGNAAKGQPAFKERLDRNLVGGVQNRTRGAPGVQRPIRQIEAGKRARSGGSKSSRATSNRFSAVAPDA